MRDFAGTPKLVHAAFRKMRDNLGTGDAPGGTGPRPTLTVCPNPFSSVCTFRLNQALREPACVRIYDLAGRLVDDLLVPRGQRQVSWSGPTDASGAYVARIVSGNACLCRRLLLARW
jgi:hypothetical protein